MRRPLVWRAKRREQWFARQVPHELAICAIFREEAPFLDEWLEFHAGVGVSHFYLYNNFSTDHFRDVLNPWIDRGVVSLVEWPRAVGQLPAYRHCLRHAWRDCRWIAFIDVDEFLFSPLSLDVRKVLDDYGDLPGVEVWQVFFGSGGRQTRPASLVTESYLRCAGPDRTTVKSIVNPRRVYKPGVHQFRFLDGQAIDSSRRRVLSGQPPVFDRLRINHYWSRSLEDLRIKIARGDASTATRRDLAWHLEFEKTLNELRDESILPITRAIRGENGETTDCTDSTGSRRAA